VSRADSTARIATSPYLYRVDPDAVIRMDAYDERALNALFASIKQRLGSNIRVSCWPYRHGQHWCLALDLEGSTGEVNLTLFAGDEPRLPGVRNCNLALTVEDWRVSDGIDAFYVVCSLLSVLEAMPGSTTWPFLGLKRIAR
jgi:hypothetical protein